MGAVPRDRQESIMATIGTFTRSGDSFTGSDEVARLLAATTCL